ncbi:hypothetical protein KPL37_17920 [Clostridium frigoris]|uniref:Uncharacterized protein n=1 Tax=Clostridium frigoris TaxID=205327 RepID=A0ABS6BYD3_9CLOT|nr:hypothetical protein [Clostridium frigoris]
MNNNNKSKPKSDGKTMKRLFSYVTSTYKIQFVIVIVCILISALAGVGVLCL